MAEVQLAVGFGPGGFNKLLVLKTLLRELSTDSAMRELFLAEARLSARLNHPNVVQVYEIIDSVQPCIVMEYLEGRSVSAIHHCCGDRFTRAMQLCVVSEALAGLHYSHELRDYDGTPLGIVHRDVSPQNIFVTYDGIVKVLDFGIAKAKTTTDDTTKSGTIKGKLCYMPREQMLADPIDRRADIYAVGCMLWQAATGTKLWAGASDGAIMRSLLDGDIPRPSTRGDVDPWLESIVMKALAPNPEDRYATALELRSVLDTYRAATYPNVSMREVGLFITEQFAQEREALSKTIYSSLSAENTTRSLIAPRSATPLATSTVIEVPRPREPAYARVRWVWAGAMAAAVLVAGIGYRVLHSARPGATQKTPAAASAPKAFELRVSTTPSTAVLAFDGEPLPDNPAIVQVKADGAEHQIRASAPGYLPALRAVRLRRDQSIELALERADPPEAQEKPASDSSMAPAKPMRPVPRGGVRSAIPRSAGKPSDCDPAFYFEQGIKIYKPECL